LPPDDKLNSDLLVVKLRALSRSALGVELEAVTSVRGGAFGTSPTTNGYNTTVWLAESEPSRSLGPALVASAKNGPSHLHLICSAESALVARRAAEFSPDVSVWEIDGSRLVPAGRAAETDLAAPAAELVELVADLIVLGVDPVFEHGVLTGEVMGLEVVRAEHDGQSWRLRVGIGDFDRDTFAMIHGQDPSASVMAEVVETVASHRRPGAQPHPLNRMSAERWLRAVLIEAPGRIGLGSLAVAEPPVRRTSVRETVPAVAIGYRDGTEVVVVTSCGIDLDLIPYAADARRCLRPEAPLLVVLAERDAHRITREIASTLHVPAELIVIDNDWRGWPSGTV